MNRHKQEAISIETLKEILGLLRITEEYVLDKNRTWELVLEDMLTVPVVHNKIA